MLSGSHIGGQKVLADSICACAIWTLHILNYDLIKLLISLLNVAGYKPSLVFTQLSIDNAFIELLITFTSKQSLKMCIGYVSRGDKSLPISLALDWEGSRMLTYF